MWRRATSGTAGRFAAEERLDARLVVEKLLEATL